MKYKVSHPTGLIECDINLPSSKSISNRLLIIQSLCKDKFRISNLSKSDDTYVLQKALKSRNRTIDIGFAGTSFRFLTSYFASSKDRDIILTGSSRIKKRPIKELVRALNSMGAKVSYCGEKDHAPLRIEGRDLLGGEIVIPANISSQFISSLLLIAPTLSNGLKIHLSGKIVSRSYIDMTLKLMRDFGIDSSWDDHTIKISHQDYIARDYAVEADWSSASVWYQIAALSKECHIKLKGLREDSIQADNFLIKLFKDLSVESKFHKNDLILKKTKLLDLKREIDIINTPDLYISLVCTLYALGISKNIKGIDTLIDKESNRIESIQQGIIKLKNNKDILTYHDHRIAMGFAPLCLNFGELSIDDPKVVSKSYPNFWKDFKKAGFIIDL